MLGEISELATYVILIILQSILATVHLASPQVVGIINVAILVGMVTPHSVCIITSILLTGVGYARLLA